MRNLARAAGFRAGLALLAAALPLELAAQGGAIAPDKVNVSLPEARLIARRAVGRGQAGLARHVALGLLQADNQDFVALLVLAVAEGQLRNPAASLDAGKRAYVAAPDAAGRYEASVATAAALAAQGKALQSKFWLRRAAQNAPDAASRAAAAAHHRSLSSQAPLALRFSFSAAPSSNVNNGTRHETVQLFGQTFVIDSATQALSGFESSLGLSASYRLRATHRSRTEALFRFYGRKVTLSANAKSMAPAARGSDYDFAVLEAGLSHRFRPGAAPLVWTLAATAGHSWSGGTDLADFLRLDTGVEYAISNTAGVAVTFGAERQWRRDDASFSADILSLSSSYIRKLGSGDQITLTLGLRDTNSPSVRVDHSAVTAQIDWQQGKAWNGLRLSGSVSVQSRTFSPTLLAPAGRQDMNLRGQVGIAFERLDYMGFAPTLDLTASRNRSDLIQYDGRNLGLQLGFKSTF